MSGHPLFYIRQLVFASASIFMFMFYDILGIYWVIFQIFTLENRCIFEYMYAWDKFFGQKGLLGRVDVLRRKTYF